jgi:hypothetical protein
MKLPFGETQLALTKRHLVNIVKERHKTQYANEKDSSCVYQKPKPSVPDPDLPDPHVFGPPGSESISLRYGSGSGSFYHSKKNLDSYYFVTSF